jgi:4-hydroxy-3-methylbut-2-enyl diphosphate reductase
MENNANLEFSDTICRQVANRIPNITTFAQENDIIVFVSGIKSSNGKVLYDHALSINPNSYIVSKPDELEALEIDLTKKIGICGATSTPRWLMEAVMNKLNDMAAKA